MMSEGALFMIWGLICAVLGYFVRGVVDGQRSSDASPMPAPPAPIAAQPVPAPQDALAQVIANLSARAEAEAAIDKLRGLIPPKEGGVK